MSFLHVCQRIEQTYKLVYFCCKVESMNFESHLNPAGGGLTRKRRLCRFISCIFKPQSLQLDWINLFMGPLAHVVLTRGPQFYPFAAQWDEYRLCRPWLEMLHFKLQYILIAECWKLMRNCFSGIIVPPISSYSLVRKYNFKALIVPSSFFFYQLSVFFSQSHFYFANYDGNQMEKCNLLRWKEAFVP